MFDTNNYIAFHDLSPEGRIFWASPSIYNVLGYEPDEVIGFSGYDLVYEDDHPSSRVIHKENVMNDFVASQIIVRFKAKDGRPVPCVSVFSLCYDFILNCCSVVDPNEKAYGLLRAHSQAMTRLVGPRKEELERIRRHHEAFVANTWDLHGLEPEPRVCMILNRFSRSLPIMYASSACQLVFHIDPAQIVGKPVLLFIRADDMASFVEQVDMVKATSVITHMRLWFQSPNWPQEIPCEAMLFGAADGMVAIMRRCKPFSRKRFIGSTEQYDVQHLNNSSHNSKQSWKSSWSSDMSSRSYSTTPSTSISSSSACQLPHFKPISSVRNVPLSQIRNIKIVELDEARIRPVAVPKDDPTLVRETSAFPHGIKELHIQEYEDEDDDEEEDGDDGTADMIRSARKLDTGGFVSASDNRYQDDLDMEMY
ncbi:hypothetical protein EDD11_004825 [Mortierella claussenii]|nr:hypothetical protein EDD11_004825 [Mortierella claussenii]